MIFHPIEAAVIKLRRDFYVSREALFTLNRA
jgi:hypothetical protein